MAQRETGRRDGHMGGARALAGVVRIVCAANIALALGAGAFLGMRFETDGAELPIAGLALAVAVSAAMVSALREGRAE